MSMFSAVLGAMGYVNEDAAKERAWGEWQRQARDLHDIPIPVSPFNAHVAALGAPDQSRLMAELVKADSDIATRAIATRGMSIGLHAAKLLPDGETQRDPDTLLEDLLTKPNGTYRMSQMIFHTLSTLPGLGGAFWQVLHSEDARQLPIALWPMRFDAVKPVSAPGIPIAGYEVTGADGTTHKLEPREVINFWFPDPSVPTAPRGRLLGQAVTSDTAAAQRRRLLNFYERDGTPRVALQTAPGNANPQAFGSPERLIFEVMWRNRHSRQHGTAMGLPAIAPPGMQFHEFGEPSFDSEVNVMNALSEKILMAYGVPKAVLGVVTDVNRANTDAVRFIMDINTMLPLMTLIVETLTQQLAIQFDEGLLVEHEEFVAEDKEFNLRQEQQRLAQGVVVVDEVRESDSLPKTTYGALPIMSIGSAPYDGTDPFSSSPTESEAALDGPRSSPDGARAERVRAHFHADAQWIRNEETERKFIGPMRRLVGRILRAQQRSVLDNLENAARSRALVDVGVDQLFSPGDPRWIKAWRETVGPQWKEIFEAGAQEVYSGLELGTFNLTSSMLENVVTGMDALRANTNNATFRSLEKILSKGIADGASVDSVAARIRDLDEGVFSQARSRTIARTQIGEANQQGQLEGMESSQVVEAKTWNTSRGPRVRDSHRIEGQTVLLVDRFTLGDGETCKHPLDPTLSARNKINCECFITAAEIEDVTL